MKIFNKILTTIMNYTQGLMNLGANIANYQKMVDSISQNECIEYVRYIEARVKNAKNEHQSFIDEYFEKYPNEKNGFIYTADLCYDPLLKKISDIISRFS